MKRYYKTIEQSVLLSMIFLLIALGHSCTNNDDLSDRDEFQLFFLGDYLGIRDNSISATINYCTDGSGNLAPTMSEFPIVVRASREASKDINVDLVGDATMVEPFNTAYNTAFLQGTATIPSQLTIAKGQVVSPSSNVSVSTPSTLTNSFTATSGFQTLPADALTSYLIPVRISGSSLNGATICSNFGGGVLYMKALFTYNNIIVSESELTGTESSAYTATSVGGNTSYPVARLYDTNYTTSWRSNNVTTERSVTIDLTSASKLKGFNIASTYDSNNYNPTAINVWSSNDNINWNYQGRWTGTGYVAGTTNADPTIKGIGFTNPVSARYFKLVVTACVSGNTAGISELKIVR